MSIRLPGQYEPEPDQELTRAAGTAVPEPAGEPAGDRVPELVPGMREPDPVPVPARAAGEPGTGAALVPAITAPAGRIGAAEHLFLLLCGWIGRVAASQKIHGSFWRWAWERFWGNQPESLRQHRQHVKSRDWLPDYMTGWLRTLAVWESIAYHCILARSVKALCNNVSTGVERQSRFWKAVLIALVALAIWLMAHH